MRTATCLLIVSTGLVIAAEPVNRDPSKTDVAKLQGAWSIVSVEVEGNPLAMDKLDEARLIVRGEHYSFRLDGIELEIVYRLDAGKSPKTIDLTLSEGVHKGKVFRGIYKLDHDRYTICRTTEPEKDRPTEFATRPGSGHMMVVWKRAAASVSK